MIPRHHSPPSTSAQRGVYAVEYALVFPVFFLLFYATLAYGTVFTLRLGLQHAAEEGARAALRFAPQLNPMSPQDQIVLRLNRAEAIATDQSRFIAGLGARQIDAVVCALDQTCPAPEGATPAPTPDCAAVGTQCQIVVSVSYSYVSNPVFPALPGFGLLMPDLLLGRSRVLLDARGLAL